MVDFDLRTFSRKILLIVAILSCLAVAEMVDKKLSPNDLARGLATDGLSAVLCNVSVIAVLDQSRCVSETVRSVLTPDPSDRDR